MKKIIIIIVLVLIAAFVIWQREPWVKTYPTKIACETAHSKERLTCYMLTCDNIQTTFWLDCPHGSNFWKPAYQYTQ